MRARLVEQIYSWQKKRRAQDEPWRWRAKNNTASSDAGETWQNLEAELLDGILARQQLRRDYPERGEHGEAAIVQLAGSHLCVVLPQAERIAEVAGFLRWALCPDAELEGACHQEQSDHPIAPWRRQHCRQARWHGLETWELNVVLRDGPHSRHHGHAAMLDLRRAQGAETRLVALFAETSRVEISQGGHGPNLHRRVETGRHICCASHALLATLCQTPC